MSPDFSPVEARFAQYAKGFVTAPVARILIHLPGCQEVCVNPAHDKEFAGQFPVALTQEDVILQFRNALQKTDAEWDLNDKMCYCYPTGAAVALIGDHCVFDRTHDKLLLLGEHNLHTDFGVRLISLENGKRDYKVFRTSARMFKAGNSYFLDSERSQFDDITLQVTTVAPQEDAPPKELSSDVFIGDELLFTIPPKPVNGSEDYNHIYAEFFKAETELRKYLESGPELAYGVLDESRESLAKAVESFADRKHNKNQYLAVVGFINGIYGPNRSRKTIRAVVDELKTVRSRFFDAIILSDIIKNRLPASIVNWESFASVTTL